MLRAWLAFGAVAVLSCDSGRAPAPLNDVTSRFEALRIIDVPVDAPIVGPAAVYETAQAGWDGRRFVVAVSNGRQIDCITYLADGTREVDLRIDSSKGLVSLVFDEAGVGRLIASQGGQSTMYTLGLSCAGPVTETALPTSAFDLSAGWFDGGLTLLSAELIDAGETSLRFRVVGADAGVLNVYDGRLGSWLSGAVAGDKWFAVSQRSASNANPWTVDVVSLPSLTPLSVTPLPKDPLNNTTPTVVVSGAQVLVSTTSSSFITIARRFTTAGALIDMSDLMLGSDSIRGPAPNGFLLAHAGSPATGATFSVLKYDGSQTPQVVILPDVDGGLPTQYGPDVPKVVFGPTTQVLLSTIRGQASSIYLRPLDSALGPAGPLQLVKPRVNNQLSPVATVLSSGLLATWVDDRGGTTRIVSRGFDDSLSPTSSVGAAPTGGSALLAAPLLDGSVVVTDWNQYQQPLFISLDGDGGTSARPLHVYSMVAQYAGLASTGDVAFLFRVVFDASTTSFHAIELTRFTAMGEVAPVNFDTNEIAFFGNDAVADDNFGYFTVATVPFAIKAYKAGKTGPMTPLATLLGAPNSLVRSREGFCGLTLAGYECLLPDAGVGLRGSWPAPSVPFGAYDGQRIQVCLIETTGNANRWFTLEPDGGLFERLLPGETCAPMTALGPERLVLSRTVLTDFSDGVAQRARLHLIDFLGVPVDAGAPDAGGGAGDAGLQGDGGAAADAGVAVDAGALFDAGAGDAGSLVVDDAGSSAFDDAGSMPGDAGVGVDGGRDGLRPYAVGCGCSSSGPANQVGGLALMLLCAAIRAQWQTRRRRSS